MEGAFGFLDWAAVVLLFGALAAIALLCSRRAGRDAKDFFLSGRSMPWWLVGVSMCAASTSTNSANMFTEFIRNSSLAENWKWWAFLLTGMLTATDPISFILRFPSFCFSNSLRLRVISPP